MPTSQPPRKAPTAAPPTTARHLTKKSMLRLPPRAADGVVEPQGDAREPRLVALPLLAGGIGAGPVARGQHEVEQLALRADGLAVAADEPAGVVGAAQRHRVG